VLFLGDSHARECASEIKRHLNNEYKVFGFINTGSGMKDKKGSPKMKVTQLTREDIVVLWGGANDVGRKKIHGGHETYIRSVDKFNSYQCDPIKCPS
jgi:hypothetical protein